MPSFRVDADLYSRAEWFLLSPTAKGLWVGAAGYAAYYAINGAVPRASLRLHRAQPRHARELVKAGFWREYDGGGVSYLAGWQFVGDWCSFDRGSDRKSIPPRIRSAVIKRDGRLCGLCGGEVELDDIHIDHIQPVSLGGGNKLSNLQVAHSACNIRKGNRV